jgi:hypothetical protein
MDTAGNISTTSTSLTYLLDQTAPVLSQVQVNSGAANVSIPFVTIKVAATDSYNTFQIRLKEADGTLNCQAVYADDGWVAYTGASQNYSFQISTGDGTKKVCAWTKDSVGNISAISPETGVLGVNMDTIEYFVGNPPVVTSLTVTNDRIGADFGTTKYQLGDPVKIAWTITDQEGLADQSVALSYSTDGNSWTEVPGTYGTTSGHPTTSTSSYSGWGAPSTGYFRIKIVAYDASGNSSIAILSNTQNTDGWQIFAGTTDRGVGGTGKAALLTNSLGGDSMKAAVDVTTNDIYVVDDISSIKKYDAKTGVVSTFLWGGTTNLGNSGTLSAASRILVGAHTEIASDGQGRIYVNENGSYESGQVIYQIDPATLAYRRYLGGGLSNDTGATPFGVHVVAQRANFAFDEDNTLYFWSSCTPGTWDNAASTNKLRLLIRTAVRTQSHASTEVVMTAESLAVVPSIL